MSALRRQTLRLYDRVDVEVVGAPAFLGAVADYFWPQAQPTESVPGPYEVHLVESHLRPETSEIAKRRPIVLYASPDGYVPDFNEGFEYSTIPGGDRLVSNPHTGTVFVLKPRQAVVVNPDAALGTRDALRVIKQRVSTAFEAAGARIVHASAFAVGDDAVIVTGPKGAGKTTTVLAAVAAGARMVSNDRLYALTVAGTTRVQGWTDPLRVVETSADAKKVVSLRSYFVGDADRLAVGPLPVRTIVIPEVGAESVPVRCEELDRAAALSLLQDQVLPVRRRWLGDEPEPADGVSPTAEHCLRLRYGYRDTARAAEMLMATVERLKS
jgi:hypothetical protein